MTEIYLLGKERIVRASLEKNRKNRYGKTLWSGSKALLGYNTEAEASKIAHEYGGGDGNDGGVVDFGIKPFQ